MSRVLVRTSDLVMGYPTGARVGPVSFELKAGETLGIIGESGAGKSTVGLEILALLRYRGGKRLGGLVESVPAPAETGYIPQDPLASLNPLFTLEDHLKETGATSQEVHNALLRARLDPERIHLRSYPHEWSGGMRQRFLIAMALVRRPRLIVADEPTSSLDVTLQGEIFDLFREIRNSGISFLLITHNLPLAASFCDHLLVMEKGRVVEEGETGAVVHRPKAAYTRRLIASIPRWEVRG